MQTKSIKAAKPTTKAKPAAKAVQAIKALAVTGNAPVKAKPEAKAAKAPAVNLHTEAGLISTGYTGLSSFTNKNRKAKIAADTIRAASQLTERMQKTFYAIRTTYAGKAFNPCGLDNAVIANLRAAGLIAHDTKTGQKTTIDGTVYLTDGEKPLSFKLTAAGLKYGKA